MLDLRALLTLQQFPLTQFYLLVLICYGMRGDLQFFNFSFIKFYSMFKLYKSGRFKKLKSWYKFVGKFDGHIVETNFLKKKKIISCSKPLRSMSVNSFLFFISGAKFRSKQEKKKIEKLKKKKKVKVKVKRDKSFYLKDNTAKKSEKKIVTSRRGVLSKLRNSI